MKKRINTVPLAVQMVHSLGWLPAGWIMEIKTRKSGTSAGTQYKCYIAPMTGCKFYSKQEVFRYLKTGVLDLETPQPKRKTLNAPSADNVVSRIENSPDGLPPGWMKEIKFRKRHPGHGCRRDPYYTDPVTGCVFRSKRDAIYYIETGNLGVRVSKPKNMCLDAINSTDNKLSSPVTAKRQKFSGNSARRCLFESRSLNISEATAEQISGSTIEKQSSVHVDSNRSYCTTQGHSKTRQGKRVQVKQHSSVSEDKKLSESRDNKPLVNGEMLESEDKHQLENQVLGMDKQPLQNVALSELDDKKQNCVFLESRNELWNGVPLKSGDNKQTQSEVLLESQDGKPSENCVLMESEDTKPQVENQLLEAEKQLAQNVLLSELDDKKQKEVDSESSNTPSRNGMPMKPGDSKQTGMMLESQDRKPSDSWALMDSDDTKLVGNGVPLESEVKTPLEESQVEANCKTGRARLRSSKLKAEKLTLLPRRVSKRLAGLEAEVALDIMSSERAHRVAARLATGPAAESTTSNCADKVSEQLDHPKLNLQADSAPCTSKETKDQPEKPLIEQPPEDEKPASKDQPEKPLIEKPPEDEKPASPLILPFGDSWPDPCLEFAYKTLTGDIPVAMDTMSIEDYFQQQLGVDQTQSLGSYDLLHSELLFQSGKDLVEQREQELPEEKGKRQ